MGRTDYTRFCELYNRYVYMLQKRSIVKYPNKLQELSELRKIPLHVLEDAGAFYIGESTELLISTDAEIFKALPDFGVISGTNKAPIYHDRWVFPIKDIDANVLSLVGYTNTETERYIYATAKYYDRADDFFGMEKLKLGYQLGYVVLTEGITDALAYRGLGYEVSLANCGVNNTIYKRMLLDRLKHGVIRVHDRDFAGKKTRQTWDYRHTKTLVTPYGFKDSAQILEKSEWRDYFEDVMPKVVECLITDTRQRGDELIYI